MFNQKWCLKWEIAVRVYIASSDGRIFSLLPGMFLIQPLEFWVIAELRENSFYLIFNQSPVETSVWCQNRGSEEPHHLRDSQLSLQEGGRDSPGPGVARPPWRARAPASHLGLLQCVPCCCVCRGHPAHLYVLLP